MSKESIREKLKVLGIDLDEDHILWLENPENQPFPIQDTKPVLADAVMSLGKPRLMLVQNRLFPLEPAVKRFETVKLLSQDIEDALLEYPLAHELSPKQLQWLFWHEPCVEIDHALIWVLESLKADFALIGPIDGSNIKNRHDCLINIPPIEAGIAIARELQIQMTERMFLMKKGQTFCPRLAEYLPPPSDKWVVAGGSVMNALLQNYPDSSDLDIFVFNSDYASLCQLILYYQSRVKEYDGTIHYQQLDRVTTLRVFDVRQNTQNLIQLILSNATNSFDLVQMFDCAASQCFWEQKSNKKGRIVATLNCLEACRTRVIRHTQRIRESRIAKFEKRGFTFAPPIRHKAKDLPEQFQPSFTSYFRYTPGYQTKMDRPIHYLCSLWRQNASIWHEPGIYWSQIQANCIPASELPQDWLEKLDYSIPCDCEDPGLSIRYKGCLVTFELEPQIVEKTIYRPISFSFPPNIVCTNPKRILETKRFYELISELDKRYPKIDNPVWPIGEPRGHIFPRIVEASQILNGRGETHRDFKLKKSKILSNLWGKSVACKIFLQGIEIRPGAKYYSRFNILECWILES